MSVASDATTYSFGMDFGRGRLQSISRRLRHRWRNVIFQYNDLRHGCWQVFNLGIKIKVPDIYADTFLCP
jgi:hypothetical protein